jgi:hypothetical protein
MKSIYTKYIFALVAVVFLCGNLFAAGFSPNEYSIENESVSTVRLSTGIPEINFDEDNIQVNVKNGKNRLPERSEKLKSTRLPFTITAACKFLFNPKHKYNSSLSLLRLHCILRI